MIIANILLVGLGLIIAMGGLILLDRRRFDTKPRLQYRAATLLGAAMAIAPMAGLI